MNIQSVLKVVPMKIPNPNSATIHINLDPELKAKAIELAKKRWGKNGTLTMLITDLIVNADELYAKKDKKDSRKIKPKGAKSC